MIEDAEKLKRAIDVEVKHRYIDIHGKTQCFSRFIISEAKKYYKLSKKNPKWAVIAETFEHYPYASVPERRRSIEHLVKVIKSEINKDKQQTNDSNGLKDSQITLKSPSQTDVTYVKGVGPKVAYHLNKLGIYTAQDLIFYLPRKHIDYSSRTLIKDLQEGQSTTVFGYIKSVSAFNSKNNLSVVKVKIADESGFIELGFFQAKGNRFTLERTKAQFPVNAGIMVSGTVKMNNYDRRLTFDKPSYSIMTGEFLENSSSNLNLARIVPIYTVCENLNVKTLRKAIFNAIQLYKDSIKDILPPYIKEKYNLLDKKTAIEQIHFPESQEQLEQARFSLIFEELFIIQLKMVRLRNENNKHSALALTIKRDGLVQKFIDSLPFELTGGQKRAVNEILNDLNSEKPMARLLQGDVGSGKTVVACIMLLAGVENGYQGAMMAPTEILAQQHYNNLVNWLTPLGLSVGLFLGSQSKKVREKFQTDLRNGQTNIAVGTHALIQDTTDFNNLDTYQTITADGEIGKSKLTIGENIAEFDTGDPGSKYILHEFEMKSGKMIIRLDNSNKNVGLFEWAGDYKTLSNGADSKDTVINKGTITLTDNVIFEIEGEHLQGEFTLVLANSNFDFDFSTFKDNLLKSDDDIVIEAREIFHAKTDEGLVVKVGQRTGSDLLDSLKTRGRLDELRANILAASIETSRLME